MTETVRIKRCHGLGNVMCLLPVLDRLEAMGNKVIVQTLPDWIGAFGTLRPRITWTAEKLSKCFDLDTMTENLQPCEHRVDEFGRMLGVAGPWPELFLDIPQSWQSQFAELEGCVIFAPEGGHPSRCWPTENARALKQLLSDEKLVLVGQSAEPRDIPADVDTRATLTLPQLFGLLSQAKAIITMDSAVLHIATGLQKPTVALFSGIDPQFRVRTRQPVVVLQADLPCCPCNKNETCNDTFPCIAAAQPADVVAAMKQAQHIKQMAIHRLTPAVPAANQL